METKTFTVQELADFIGVSRPSISGAKDKQKYLAKKGYQLVSVEQSPTHKRSLLYTIKVVKSMEQEDLDLEQFLVGELSLAPSADLQVVKALFKKIVLNEELDKFETYSLKRANSQTIIKYTDLLVEHDWIDDVVSTYYKIGFNGQETETSYKAFQAWNIQLYVNEIHLNVIQQNFGCVSIYKETTYLVNAFNTKIKTFKGEE